MSDVKVSLPKPEVKGVGRIQYRCASCGDLMDPEDAVIVNDKSYHLAHAPEDEDGR